MDHSGGMDCSRLQWRPRAWKTSPGFLCWADSCRSGGETFWNSCCRYRRLRLDCHASRRSIRRGCCCFDFLNSYCCGRSRWRLPFPARCLSLQRDLPRIPLHNRIRNRNLSPQTGRWRIRQSVLLHIRRCSRSCIRLPGLRRRHVCLKRCRYAHPCHAVHILFVWYLHLSPVLQACCSALAEADIALQARNKRFRDFCTPPACPGRQCYRRKEAKAPAAQRRVSVAFSYIILRSIRYNNTSQAFLIIHQSDYRLVSRKSQQTYCVFFLITSKFLNPEVAFSRFFDIIALDRNREILV